MSHMSRTYNEGVDFESIYRGFEPKHVPQEISCHHPDVMTRYRSPTMGRPAGSDRKPFCSCNQSGGAMPRGRLPMADMATPIRDAYLNGAFVDKVITTSDMIGPIPGQYQNRSNIVPSYYPDMTKESIGLRPVYTGRYFESAMPDVITMEKGNMTDRLIDNQLCSQPRWKPECI